MEAFKHIELVENDTHYRACTIDLSSYKPYHWKVYGSNFKDCVFKGDMRVVISGPADFYECLLSEYNFEIHEDGTVMHDSILEFCGCDFHLCDLRELTIVCTQEYLNRILETQIT